MHSDRSTQRKFLYALVVWIVVAFVGDELALFTICRPVQQYWAVPPSNGESHFLTAASLIC